MPQFLFFSMLAVVSLAGAAPASDYVTANGTRYVLTNDAPTEMQPAYTDGSGIIWGDAIKDSNGQQLYVKYFNHQEHVAENLCQHISYLGKNARLPTREEFMRLRQSMSTDPTKESILPDGDSLNMTYDSTKPALPHLNNWFWSSSFPAGATDQNFVFGFLGTINCDGVIATYSTYYDQHLVRCVLDAQ
jgi:hypothetical protein